MIALGRMAIEHPSPEMEESRLIEVLAEGTLTVHGRVAGSSNATLLCTAAIGEDSTLAVFKPERGERPLWDFPAGLWRREVAAAELSRAFHLPLLPLTTTRDDEDFGIGSIAQYIDHDPEEHYFVLREDEALEAWFQTLAAFDVIANNSDRKAGHILRGESGLFAIDHGLCFHEEDKLRTVVWDFSATALLDEVKATLEHLATHGLPEILDHLLHEDEVEATMARVTGLRLAGELPIPNEEGHWPPYPWPLI